MNTDSKDILELSLLLDAIERHYGYDFHNYARASLLRRVRKFLGQVNRSYISDLISLLLYDENSFSLFVKQLSVPVTEMFRDPDFFQVLRTRVIPVLKTYSFIKIWHAGCATGEEVYSMVIVLEEEGLLDRCQIYATDFNDQALSIARKGIYSSKQLERYEGNYRQSGGQTRLSDYGYQMYDSFKINDRLSKKITFANHNLVTDGVFGEMNLVLCRNVLIYFNQILQERVLGTLVDSLCPFGVLCIGKRENLRFCKVAERLESLDLCQRIYRKKE